MGMYVDVARRVLQEAGKPLPIKEIVKRARRDPSFKPQTETPEASIWARMHEEMKKNGEQSTFVRAGRSVFGLRGHNLEGGDSDNGGSPDLEGGDSDNEVQDRSSEKGVYTTDSLYVGAAGEHRVESELLFRGYDASMTSVDKGIDIVARKDGHVFDIQVKTVTMSRAVAGAYITSIKKKTFDGNKAQNMYYIFALKDNETIIFIVLPFSVVSKSIKEGRIKEYKNGLYQVSFKVHKDGEVTIKKDESVTFYKNNWNLGQLG